MGEKEKREAHVGPVILKFGVALAFSLGGVLYTFITSRRIKPSNPKPSHRSPGNSSSADSRRETDLQELYLPKVSSPNSLNTVSSNGTHNGDRNSFVLPELDQLLKEYDLPAMTNECSTEEAEQCFEPGVDSPKERKCSKQDAHNSEIMCLRNQVKYLEEREKMLEVQLLEYYGLKEQETAVMELQNRLRLNNMEAKLYSLKIESLQSDKRRLEAQVSDYAKVVAELEDAKAKIRLLRKKLRVEAEHNREQILSLQERVMKLQDQEIKGVESGQDVETKELEKELEEMKRSNESLKLENSELARKLECVQMLATSALDDEEVQKLKEESHLLKQQNEDLRKEIEQLQADRCTDIEELVYLRWLNACLRYEMRNYQPGPGKTIARDLSKSLSPKSEEKAKQLILEYANKEGLGDMVINFSDFDSDRWSTSQTSLTDSGEPDGSPTNTFSVNNSSHSSKAKILTKLMKIVRGKDEHDSIQKSSSTLERTASMDDIVSRYRHSLDLQKSVLQDQKSNTGESSKCSRRASDDCSLSIYRTIGSINEYDSNSCPAFQPHEDAQNAAKIELVKYAEALKKSRVKPSYDRRARSLSSF